MKNERILSYKVAQKLSPQDLESVSAAGTSQATGTITYTFPTGVDGNLDVTYDM
jgi:hypothetical protein